MKLIIRKRKDKERDMRYKTFRKMAVYALTQELGMGYRARIKRDVGCNGVKEYALVLDNIFFEPSVLPLLPLKPYYKKYQGEEITNDCIAQILSDYHKLMADMTEADGREQALFEWEAVKGHVYPMVVCRKKNREFLAGLAKRKLLDLAVCYIIRLEDFDGLHGFRPLKVGKDMCRAWGISETELHAQALENMKTDGYEIREMEQTLCELGRIASPNEEIKDEMFILTNERKLFGAAGMLLDDGFFRDNFGDRNFYIIPSSIHELLLVPDKGDRSVEALNQMVWEVNHDTMKRQERLVDHVYYYDREKKEVQDVREMSLPKIYLQRRR